MLLDSIGGIFDQNFSTSLARFRVPDIGIDQAGLGVVLLVESPHTHEVCHHYPLAGPRETDAGRIVRDKLMECRQASQLPERPIGRLVLQGDTVQQLGIMNVSQLPFLGAAYDCTPWAENDCRGRYDEWRHYIGYMKTIVENPGARRRVHARCLQLDNAIATDLGDRLANLHTNNPDVLLVRCGRAAQAFYGKTDITMLHTCNLPHPTNRGSGGERWQDLDCEAPRLQEIINRLWPNPA